MNRGIAARAREETQRAIRRRVLVVPEACERCGRTCAPQAHHPDYSRPLAVEWLCVLCHFEEHRHVVGSPRYDPEIFVGFACPRCGDLVDGPRCPCGAAIE